MDVQARSEQPEVKPSRPIKPVRKPRAPYASDKSSRRRKYPPPLPAQTASSHPTTRPNGFQPTLPNKVLQGQGTRRIDASRTDFGRGVIFVTRKVSLGALMGRCRKLVVEEGYTRLTLYAINAAIPHALLLLHALIDLLPYPKGPKGMWYEIHTGTVECVDEVDVAKGSVDGEDEEEDEDEGSAEDKFAGIGGIEVDEPKRKTRLSSTIRIDLHITPKAPPRADKPKRLGEAKKPNRKSKRQRASIMRRRQAEGGDGVVEDVQMDEEEEMNAWGGEGGMESEEEEEVEEVEEIEER